jgi:hypothetical protein
MQTLRRGWQYDRNWWESQQWYRALFLSSSSFLEFPELALHSSVLVLFAVQGRAGPGTPPSSNPDMT